MSTTTVPANVPRERSATFRIFEAIANPDFLVVSAFALVGLLLTLWLGAVLLIEKPGGR
jgi:hypothetical protein